MKKGSAGFYLRKYKDVYDGHVFFSLGKAEMAAVVQRVKGKMSLKQLCREMYDLSNADSLIYLPEIVTQNFFLPLLAKTDPKFYRDQNAMFAGLEKFVGYDGQYKSASFDKKTQTLDWVLQDTILGEEQVANAIAELFTAVGMKGVTVRVILRDVWNGDDTDNWTIAKS